MTSYSQLPRAITVYTLPSTCSNYQQWTAPYDELFNLPSLQSRQEAARLDSAFMCTLVHKHMNFLNTPIQHQLYTCIYRAAGTETHCHLSFITACHTTKFVNSFFPYGNQSLIINPAISQAMTGNDSQEGFGYGCELQAACSMSLLSHTTSE